MLKINYLPIRLIVPVIFVLWMVIGCSSGNSGPTSPQISGNSAQTQNAAGNVLPWGLYDVTVDTETCEVTIVPLRGAMMTLNVTGFLKPPKLIIKEVDVGDFLSKGIIGLTVTIVHPFPTINTLTGFEVMGVVMGNGTQTSKYDAVEFPAENELHLINADGYTRWMNAMEFTTPGLFGYTGGSLGTKGFKPKATINGYKIFADGLEKEQTLREYYDYGVGLEKDTSFSPGSINSRRYVIQSPMVDGKPQLKFQYQVIAHWAAPSGNPPVFPDSAHCYEAFAISCDPSGSNAFYLSPTHYGGELALAVTVFDYRGNIQEDIDHLWIESANGIFNTPDPYVFDYPNLPDTMQCGENYCEFVPIAIPVSPTKTGSERILIGVTARPEISYDQGTGADYPEGVVTAYLVYDVPILAHEEGVYVAKWGDDANPGTKELPLLHLSAALTMAKDLEKNNIYLADEPVQGDNYTEENTIMLEPGIHIWGACDPLNDWAPKEGAQYSTVKFSTQNEYGGVQGIEIKTETIISHMEFIAASADDPLWTPPPGWNSTVVHLQNCDDNLYFEYCSFVAGNGADGVDGIKGEVDGAPGVDGGAGGPTNFTQEPPGSGGCSFCGCFGGTGGLAGFMEFNSGEKTFAGKGEDGTECYIPDGEGKGGDGGYFYYYLDPDTLEETMISTPGEMGGPGAHGSPGANGLGGNGDGNVVSDIWEGSDGNSDTDGGNGCPGGGGGGGGGGIGNNGMGYWVPYCYGGAGGGGGEGGCGGEGGTGGSGGGGSFCVFLVSSSPSFSFCSFIGDSQPGPEGGQGGKGFGGGIGGVGGSGGPGGAEQGTTDGRASRGGPGGPGGNGGDGGCGGGGGGGVSWCIYCYMGDCPDTSTCTFTVGQGGAGGTSCSGGNDGLPGNFGKIYP